MKFKLLASLVMLTGILSLYNTVNVFATDNTNYSSFGSAMYKQGVVAPFSVDDSNEENIDLVSGNLEIKHTDLHLKGRNGLDFDLTRYYSTGDANVYAPRFDNGQNSNYNDPTTFNLSHYDIGIGWSFNIPAFEFTGTDTAFLHLGDKGVYPFSLSHVNGTDNFTKPIDYELNDIKIKKDTSYSDNGTSSIYALYEKDGKKIYFNASGRAMAIVDRYGNSIKFQYSNVSLDGQTLLTKVIDSVGRIITFDYSYVDPSTGAREKVTIKVTNPNDSNDSRQIIYYVLRKAMTYGTSTYNNLGYLCQVDDPEGRSTVYGYDWTGTGSTILGQNAKYNYSSHSVTQDNWYVTMRQITYPSGATKSYSYIKSTKNLGTTGAMEFYKVSGVTDQDLSGQVLFRYYSYNCQSSQDGVIKACEYDGYPYYILGSYSMTGPIIYNYNFAIKTTVNNYQNKLSKEYHYEYDAGNYRPLCTSIIETSSNSNITTNYDYYGITSGVADLLKQKTKITKNVSNPNQSITQTELYDYDFSNPNGAYGDLTGYWDVQDNGAKGTEHKTSYVYDQNYHFVTQKTYKKDASTAIEEDFVPTTDGKGIAEHDIYENGTMRKKVRYTYDAYGNVVYEENYSNTAWNDPASAICTTYAYNGDTGNNVFLTGKSVSWIIDADGNLVNTNNGTLSEVYKYNYFGDVIQKTDAKGNVTKYEYDKLGRKTKETHVADNTYKTWSYVTNSTENSVTVTDENGVKLKTRYDGLGSILDEKDITDSANPILINEYMYDSYHRLHNEFNYSASGQSREVYYEFYDDNRLKVKLVEDSGNNTVYEEDYAYEDANNSQYNLTIKTVKGDANSPSIVTKTYMNKLNQLEKQGRMHGTNEYIDTFGYDYLGNKTGERIARANDEAWASGWTTSYQYDFEGRLTKTTNINNEVSMTDYDFLGRPIRIYDHKGSAAGTKYYTTNKYDAIGRLIEEDVPFENSTGTITYTVKKHYYDANGNVTLEKVTSNKPGDTTSYSMTGFEYNGRDFLTKVITYKTDGTVDNIAQYYYDGAGNKKRMYTGLTSPLTITGLDVVTPGTDTSYSVTKYDYDHFNKLSNYIDPLLKQETYVYNLDGTLKTKTDRNGSTFTYTYDALYNVNTETVVTKSGAGNVTTTYTYTATGKRKSANVGGITTTYTYDDLGRLKTETTGTAVKTYDYDAADSRKSFVLSIGGVNRISLTYSYDNLNRLQNVYENGSASPTATYAYDANGNRQTLTYGLEGCSTTYTYNLANKLTSLVNNKGTNVLSQFTYAYYLNGNQESKIDNLGSTSYVYDGAGRLVSVTEPGSVVTSYTYDDYNNRKTLTYTVNSTVYYTTSYDYGTNGQRLLTETKTQNGASVPTTYTYDDNGNQLTSTVNGVTTTNTYNGLNQLTAVSGINAAYTYNADGQRVTKSVGGVLTNQVWDGNDIVMETDSSNNVKGKYLRGINLIVSDDGVNRRYYFYNGHGDVVQLGDATGTIVKNYNYDAFGARKLLYGDINGNGKIESADSTILDRYLNGTITQLPTTEGLLVADVNGNGLVNSQDLSYLQRYILQMITSFPADKNQNGNVDDNEVNAAFADSNPFRYCGEYFDKETGTIYLRARYYNPADGRFTTEDSVWSSPRRLLPETGDDKVDARYQVDDPLSLNLYTYCYNNPISLFDPSGHKIELSSNATDEQKKEYNKAIEYLKTSKDGKALVKKLENSEVIFTMNFVNSTYDDSYEPSTKTINWDITGGIVMSNGTSVMSAAMCLAHEMGHGAQHLDGELDASLDGKMTHSEVEEANVKKHETPIAKQLGEPTRASYNSVKGVREMNNSIHFITTHPGWLGWFTPYTAHHNRYPIAGTGTWIGPAK